MWKPADFMVLLKANAMPSNSYERTRKVSVIQDEDNRISTASRGGGAPCLENAKSSKTWDAIPNNEP